MVNKPNTKNGDKNHAHKISVSCKLICPPIQTWKVFSFLPGYPCPHSSIAGPSATIAPAGKENKDQQK